MLARFQKTLEARGLTRVQLRRADVLSLEDLPSTWANYDLILSASMLEYLPKRDLPRALRGLRARQTPGGRILVLITRKTPETRVLIAWWWRAERYTKHELLRAFKEAGYEFGTALDDEVRAFFLLQALSRRRCRAGGLSPPSSYRPRLSAKPRTS